MYGSNSGPVWIYYGPNNGPAGCIMVLNSGPVWMYYGPK